MSAGAALDLRAALGNYAVAVTGSGIGGTGALLNGGTGAASLSGPVTLDGDTVIGVANAAASLTLSGVISGASNLTTVGAGTVALTNPGNTFGGVGKAVNLNGGTLSVTSDGVLGNSNNALNFNGGNLRLAGAVTSARAVNLNAAGGSIDTTQNSGTFTGPFSGSGNLTMTGGNALTLSGSSSATGVIAAASGQLVVNGSFQTNSVHVGAGATLGGYGAVGAIAAGPGGAGSISPGLGSAAGHILTASSVDFTTGTFNIQLGQTGLPTFGTANASGNDLLRLTAASPFNPATTGTLGTGDVINIYLPASVAIGNTFLGGFFADQPIADVLLGDIKGATFDYYVAGGGPVVFNGNNYSTLASVDPTFAVVLSGSNETGAFASGSVNGSIADFSIIDPPVHHDRESNRARTEFQSGPALGVQSAAVPEPGTWGLMIMGALLLCQCVRRKASRR